MPVEPELLEAMFAYCDVDGDGQINYDEFANFLNWKDKMPSGGIKGTMTTAEENETAEGEVKVRNKLSSSSSSSSSSSLYNLSPEQGVPLTVVSS